MLTKHIDKAMVSRATGSTTNATGGTTTRHGDGDGRHDDGDGRHDDGRHNYGKGQHKDGWHDDGDGRHGESDGRHNDSNGQRGIFSVRGTKTFVSAFARENSPVQPLPLAYVSFHASCLINELRSSHVT